MYRRGEPRDLPAVLNEILDRIRALEDTASRRVLPAGYFWRIDGSGNLVIVRDSDDQTQAVFNA